jgi:hypothetical protein
MHNQQNYQQLNEGLRATDLKEMVHDVFEVDSFRSKMGEDQDVCVVSFKVKDRSPAKDLMEFIEKGYDFVLDADVSSGEDNKGEYSVFVEISRSPRLAEQIQELTYGVKRLTGLDELKFKYYKQSHVHEATTTNLKDRIPSSVNEYMEFVNKNKTEDVRRFFSKTLMDDLKLEGSVITITKPFGSKVQLEIVKDGATASILEGMTDGYSVDQAASSEVFWLTKVLGDYTINKIGDTFVFNNGDRSMLLKRIQ